MRILIVDDERKTRAGIIRLIERLDPESIIVGEVGNGYDGMLLIKELQPDAVITDIMMPRMSGLDMIANVREVSPGVRFLILSGYAEFELARQAIKLSAVDYLLKPITVEQMRSALAALKKSLSLKEDGEPAESEGKNGENHSYITQYIKQEIDANYTSRFYMEELAQRIGVTPEYAGNVFSRETGKTFSVYLRDVRMEKAKELLSATGEKIYEIAFKTGYSDVKYFCRVFKEYTGVSPKQYLRSSLVQKGRPEEII